MRKIKSYFQLQFRLFNRKLSDAGIHPFLVYLFGILGLVFLSNTLFSSFAYASYALVAFSCLTVAPLSDGPRNEFLLMVYGVRFKQIIRVLENTTICFPFVLVLFVFKAYPEAVLLLFSGAAMAFFSFHINRNRSFPLPFSSAIFECIIGFRKTFPVFILALILSVVAILESNINLGLFAMGLEIFTVIGYFFKPEDEYFVWIFSETPRSFLLRKFQLAVKILFLLLIPPALLLLCFYPSSYQTILTFLLVGGCLLCAIIMIKYAAYPREINVPEYLLLSLCVYFPPLVFGVIPFFYLRSKNNLQSLLHD